MKKYPALLFALCFCTNAYAQNFYKSNVTPVFENGNQLKNAWAGGINFPQLSEIDLNQDGINDLFVFDAANNRIETFINKGIANVVDYTYSPDYISKFPVLHDWAFLHDFNCDGLTDIFTFSDLPNSIAVYQNTSTIALGLQFTLVTQQLLTDDGGLITTMPCTKDVYPTFDDVDRDGDMDILDWPTSPDATVDYHINQSVENGFGCDSLIFIKSAPCWGGFSMCFGSNQVCAFNISCRAAHVQNPFEIILAKKDDTLTSMLAIDLDGDDDTDLLVGDVGSPHSLAIFNGGNATSALMVSQDTLYPSYNVSTNVHTFLQHAYFDINNDGKKDLTASCKRETFNQSVSLYIDTSSNNVPAFNFSDSMFLQREMLDFGKAAFPALFDYDTDGLMDIIVGNERYNPALSGSLLTGLAVLKNTGTLTHPQFDLINRNYADFNTIASGFSVGGAAPSFGDLDGDNDKDMLIGSEDGKLYYYTNTAAPGAPANFVFAIGNYMGIDVGNYSTPQIVDLDRDGKQDLVIGKRNGRIAYYQNTGTNLSPMFSALPTKDTLGGINLVVIPGVTGYTSPYFYDDNGNYKLYVGCERGDLYEYDNIDGNIFGNYNLVQTIISKTEGERINIGVGDLNNDNQPDMVVGNLAGGIGVYFQNVNPNSINETAIQKFDVNILPNPVDEYLNIEIKNVMSKNEFQLQIFDLKGSIITESILHGNSSGVDLSNIDNGIYFLRISSEEYSVSKKLVVLHK